MVGYAAWPLTHTLLRTVDPVGNRLPAGVVLVGKLPAARVEDVAAALGRERMQQQPAGRGIARIDQLRDHLEILARLLVGPVGLAGRQLLQAEMVVALRVTDVASRVAGTLLQED